MNICRQRCMFYVNLGKNIHMFKKKKKAVIIGKLSQVTCLCSYKEIKLFFLHKIYHMGQKSSNLTRYNFCWSRKCQTPNWPLNWHVFWLWRPQKKKNKEKENDLFIPCIILQVQVICLFLSRKRSKKNYIIIIRQKGICLSIIRQI